MTGVATRSYELTLRLLPVSAAAWLKAALGMCQILPDLAVRPLELVTPAPLRRSVRFPLEPCSTQNVAAELYVPSGAVRPCAGIVLSLGAADLGGDDPRAVTLAEMLARSGFAVLAVTGAPGLAGRDAEGPLDLDEAPVVIAAAFRYLCGQPHVDAERVGLMGVCIGGAACLTTASRPDLADRVRFVFLVGPYVSLRNVLRSIATRCAISLEGHTRPWTASEWAFSRASEWLVRSLAPSDRVAVLAALTSSDARASVGLSDRAQAVFELVRGVSVERADRLIDALGQAFVASLEAASPASHLAGIRAETLIMHSVGDQLIPVEESRRLVAALHGRVRLHYAEFTLFEHVDISHSLAAATLVREVLRLINHTRFLMRFAASRPNL